MAAEFVLAEGGVGVMPDPADNPANRQVPHSDSGVRISVEVGNVGDEPGVTTVGVECDDQFVQDRQSQRLAPGGTDVGYVSLGRLSPGEHTVLAYVNPGAGHHDHAENRFTVA